MWVSLPDAKMPSEILGTVWSILKILTTRELSLSFVCSPLTIPAEKLTNSKLKT